MDDIEEDISSLIDYKNTIHNPYGLDLALGEFFRELKELNNNLKVERSNYNVNGVDSYIVYTDMPTFLRVFKLPNFTKVKINESNYNTQVNIPAWGLVWLEEKGFIYISHVVDDNNPSNRVLSLLKMDINKKITIV